MLTTDYLREERASVSSSNPAMLSGLRPNAQRQLVVQWKIELSRRSQIALKSLNEGERKTVSQIIEKLKKIPTAESLSSDEFQAITARGFSVVFIRHGDVIEVTDVLSQEVLDQFIRSRPDNK